MTASRPGPPIRTLSAARDWFVSEGRDLLTWPFQDLAEGRRQEALISLLLWPLGLLALCIGIVEVTITVLRRGHMDEMLDRMRAKVAEGVAHDLFRYQPDGSEIEAPPGQE